MRDTFVLVLILAFTVRCQVNRSGSRILFEDFQDTQPRRKFRLSEPIRSEQLSESLLTTNFVPSSGCDDATYCNSTNEYPSQESLLRILNSEGDGHLLRMLYHHEPQKPEIYRPTTRLRPSVGITSEDTEAEYTSGDWDVQQRWNPDNTDLPAHLEQPLCDEITQYVYPKSAITRSKQWRFVINLPQPGEGDESFVQAVRVRKCLNEGGSCSATLCEDKTTKCKQMYDFTKMLAISATGTKYIDEFMFPSGCKCYSQRIGNGYKYLQVRTTEEQSYDLLDDDTVIVGGKEDSRPRRLRSENGGRAKKKQN